MKKIKLTEIVEFESRITLKLKRSFRSIPNDTPEKYYHLLMAPYLNDKYKTKGEKLENWQGGKTPNQGVEEWFPRQPHKGTREYTSS